MSGILVLVSGPSGAGKTRIVEGYLARNAARGKNIAKRIVTTTTRAMRPGEVDGQDYFFRTSEEFAQMVAEEKFVEHACVYGNHYGTLLESIEEARKNFAVAVWIADIQGVQTLTTKLPDAHTVFVTVPKNDMRERLLARGETSETIDARMKFFEQENEKSKYFQRVIANKQGKLSDTIQEFTSCVHQWSGKVALVKKRPKSQQEE